MKKLILICVYFISNYTFAQVGGISASKLATLCVGTVEKNTIEFALTITIN